jgi:NADH-quinone oxidoreductase subunit G
MPRRIAAGSGGSRRGTTNDYWICDEGRASYKSANDEGLLTSSYAKKVGTLGSVPIDQAINLVSQSLVQVNRDGGKIAAVISPSLTVEEAYLLATYIKDLNPENVLAIGPVPTKGENFTITPDQHKGRTGDTSFVVPRPFTIHAEKCPNRKGVEAVVNQLQTWVTSFEVISGRIAAGEFQALYFTSNAIDPWGTEAEAKALRDGVKFLVVQDTLVTPLAQLADVVLSGGTFAEKAGCYVNANGLLQYAEAALPPRDGSLPDLDIFAILMGRTGGPIRSRDVLAEMASSIPAFSGADGGVLPEFGVKLVEGSDHPATPVAAGGRFSDPWQIPRYLKGDRPGEPTSKGGKDA